MDNPAYHPDPHAETITDSKGGGGVFTISRGSLSAKNQISSNSRDHLVPVSSKASFFRKPKLYRTSTIVLGIVCVLLLICLITVIVIYCARRILHSYCTTDECLRSAANLKYSLDLSVDPCEDFYKYTCGHWSEEHPNHGWYTSFSSFAAVNERIIVASFNFLKSEDKNDTLPVAQSRMLYKSCVDQESTDQVGYTTIYDYLEKVGLPKIPALLSSLPENEKTNFQVDWLRIEANIKKIFSKDVFFGFSVDVNTFQVSENVMYIGTPGNVCPLPSPFRKQKQEDGFELKENDEAAANDERREQKSNIRSKIVKFVMIELLKNLTADVPSDELLEQAAFVINNMTNTIEEFTENFTSKTEVTATTYTFKEIQSEIDQFTTDTINKNKSDFLERYIELIFKSIDNVTIDFQNDILYMTETEKPYLFHIMSYLLDTSDIYIELYLWWSTVFSMIMNTTTEMIEYIVKETEVLYTSSETNSRSRSVECVEVVNKFMGMAVTYGIADKTFANTSGLQVRNMLDDIREAFRSSVDHLSWMDTATKRATLEKSRNMYSFIGFPNWLFEEGKLDDYYKDLQINEKTFLQNMMNLVEREMPKVLAKLRITNGREFPINPTEVNAYNSFSDNSIIVPLAFLTYPMYHLGLEVLNYGSIGSVLGHELTHGFDNNGRKHDKFGNYKQWWTNDTIETFEKKTECFVRQYDNLTIEGVEGKVDGKKTLGENIADNGGLNHAFVAYKNFKKRSGPESKLPGFENFTPDQLFFIAFGSIWCESAITSDIADQLENDVHCPNSVRVNMVVSNSRDFANAFHCHTGSKMNPEQKCKIW